MFYSRFLVLIDLKFEYMMTTVAVDTKMLGHWRQMNLKLIYLCLASESTSVFFSHFYNVLASVIRRCLITTTATAYCQFFWLVFHKVRLDRNGMSMVRY